MPTDASTAESRLKAWLDVPLSGQPTVAADGQLAYYVGTGGGLPEVWRVSTERGPGQRVLRSPERVGTVQAAPVGDHVLVTADAGGNEHWQLSLVPGARVHSSAAATLIPLTDAPKVMHIPGRWRPDGEHYLFSSNQRDGRFFDIHEMDVRTPADITTLLSGDALHSVAAVDGPRVLVHRANTNLDGDLLLIEGDRSTLLTPHTGEMAIFAAALRPEGVYAAANPDRELAALVRYRVGGGRHEFLKEFPGDLEIIEPSPDGTLLALVVNRDGWSETHLFDPATREDRPFNTGPKGVVSKVAWLPDSSAIVYDLSSVDGVEVWRRVVATGKERRLTGTATSVPSPVAPPRLGRFAASDGLSIPYWEYEPSRQPPVGTLIHVHGGPESQARPGFGPFIGFLVSEGWRIISPNVRGSTGYGRTFTHLDDVRRRPDSVRDVRDLAHELFRVKKAMPGRVAILGGSYGGFMVLAAASTYPELWGAAIDLVGIANFVTFLERTGPWRRPLREAEYGSLEKDRAFLEEISPIRHADRIRAPLLVIHGRNDPRVPLHEAEQIAATLTALHRPVELLVFDNEGHGIVRRENQITAWTRAAAFLSEHAGVDAGPSH